MSHFNRNIPLYRPNGEPAYGWIKIPQTLQAGDAITINGDVYTYLVDFFGKSPAMCLRSLINAIRACQNEAEDVAAGNTNFFRLYSAEFQGNYGVVFATNPGTAGNALTLATNTTRIVVSGATFANGVDAASGGSTVSVDPADGAITDGSGTIAVGNTAQQIFAAGTRKYLYVQNVSAENEWVNFSAVATAGPGSILLTPGGSQTFDANYVPQGTVSIIGATTGDGFTAKQA